MGRVRRRNSFVAVIAEPRCVNIGEKVLSGAEQGWGNGQVHFVDKSREQALPDRRNPAAEPDVQAFRRADCAFKSSIDSIALEMEGLPPSIVIEARGWLVSTNTGV
jgi:hypothetical protein